VTLFDWDRRGVGQGGRGGGGGGGGVGEGVSINTTQPINNMHTQHERERKAKSTLCIKNSLNFQIDLQYFLKYELMCSIGNLHVCVA
jgi:hypothetical protein